MEPRVRLPLAVAVLLWAILVLVGLVLRPALPVDETRYLAVAWEMWSGGDYIVPHLNGVEYHHKPPLLFWLMTLGWTIFGISETWGRLVAPLFALGCMLLTARLARMIFPERPAVAGIAPLALIGAAFFTLFATLTFFDALVAFFTLFGLIGVVIAARGHEGRGWIIYALALGLGILSKGPVQLLDMAPAALLAPLWVSERPPSWRRWYVGLALAVLGGAAIGLAWAVPAALQGSREFAYMLFLGQTTQRVVEAAWHERPFWWYVPLSFLLLFPWLWWPAFGRSLLTRGVWREWGVRFCLATLVPVFIAFSAISGKQPHYLLPLIPVFALLLGRLLIAAEEQDRFSDGRLMRLPPLLVPVTLGLALITATAMPDRVIAWQPRLVDELPLGIWALIGGLALIAFGVAVALDRRRGPAFRAATLAALTAAMVVAAHLAVFPTLRPRFDVAAVAAELAHAEAENRPVAITYDYHGQYHFAARLRRPIHATTKDDVIAWARANPEGIIVDYRSEDPATYPVRPPYTERYRGRHVILWPAAEINTHGRVLLFDQRP
jgi:4-amino-4-deoxy-L-arabinose transferase-like glycosyltransferase